MFFNTWRVLLAVPAGGMFLAFVADGLAMARLWLLLALKHKCVGLAPIHLYMACSHFRNIFNLN